MQGQHPLNKFSGHQLICPGLRLWLFASLLTPHQLSVKTDPAPTRQSYGETGIRRLKSERLNLLSGAEGVKKLIFIKAGLLEFRKKKNKKRDSGEQISMKALALS